MGKSILDNRETTQKSDRPPEVVDVLAEIASRWLDSNFVHKADPRIPRNPRDLAVWWIKNQSPPHERFDRPTQESKRDGSGAFWKTPYIDRLRYTLNAFLRLDKGFQGLIIAATEDRIFWRAESREIFLAIIAEHEKMKNDPKYKQASSLKARAHLEAFK